MKNLNENQNRFLTVFTKWLAYYYSQNDFKQKTKDNYRARYNFILNYLIEVGKVNMTIEEIDEQFVEDLRSFSLDYHSLTTASRNIELIKNACDYAVNRGLIEYNKIKLVKTKRTKPKPVVHLDPDELKKWIQYQTSHKKRTHYKAMYQFQCLTGVSNGDLWSFKIKTDDWGDWITNKRYKTGKEYWVPLKPEAKAILESYPEGFPKTRNRPYNLGIRSIAKRIGIDKHLTSHTGRKTFATLMYEDGWSAESIKDMMGIDIKILLTHYVKKSRHRIENELKIRNEV